MRFDYFFKSKKKKKIVSFPSVYYIFRILICCTLKFYNLKIYNHPIGLTSYIYILYITFESICTKFRLCHLYDLMSYYVKLIVAQKRRGSKIREKVLRCMATSAYFEFIFYPCLISFFHCHCCFMYFDLKN